MSRFAILSGGGDVFLSDFVLTLWKKWWYDEIDMMYLGYNNHAEVPIQTSYEFIRKWEKDPKIRIVYAPVGLGNGMPILQGLLNSKESALLLLEDDSFIFTPGVVNEWFSYIEAGKADMVGSPRYSVGEVAQAAKDKYNLDYSGVGDKGFGLWPSFFLCKRADLLKTDWRFASDEYKSGDYIKELDHTMENTEYTDTFTFATLQLRNMGLTVHEIPQNHAHGFDLEFKNKQEGMFSNGDPKYIHGGSLSSGWGGYLNKKLPPVTTDLEKQDIETRIAFWMIVSNPDLNNNYENFRKTYQSALYKLESNCNLNTTRIQQKYELYSKLMHL